MLYGGEECIGFSSNHIMIIANDSTLGSTPWHHWVTLYVHWETDLEDI